jgi:hypothetical protein
VHARKMRQRKKLQVQTLSLRANELKLEQQRLKQIVRDRRTADIMVALMASPSAAAATADAEFEDDILRILNRANEDIPDGRDVKEQSCKLMPSLTDM